MALFHAASSMTTDAALYLFHHVFLTPKLPQEDDYNPEYELILLENVIEALSTFKSLFLSHHEDILDSVITMVSRLRRIYRPQGNIGELELKKALKELDIDGGFLPVFIRGQNAAVLMTRNCNKIHIEPFELSPRNEAVNTTVGRLLRQFPGPTFMCDRASFNEPGLQDTIAHTLSKMSHQSVAGTKIKVMKAGQLQDEDRDATRPIMVTELFSAFLHPRCTVIESLQIQKRTREEVLWLDSRFPWRRSSLWLLIRVILQLVSCRLCKSSGLQRDLYKEFMVYFMATLLKKCAKMLTCEECHTMNAKIARRIRKLDLNYSPVWFPFVQDCLRRANDSIQKNWNDVIARNSHQLDRLDLAGLDFSKDIYCSLPDLDRFLEQACNREHSSKSADFQPESKLFQFQDTELPSCLDASDSDYKMYNLVAFENWVDHNLDPWLQAHLDDESTCKQLCSLIKHYHTVASPLYSNNPEAMSILLLTVLELWIACDRSAIHFYPMLADYDTCISMDIFESLVLPYRSQMERLARAENYMYHRQQRIVYRGPGIFKDFGTPSCFSVRYFDQSDEHQRLLDSIESHARDERAEKKAELRQKHQKYTELYALAKELQCTYYDVVIDKNLDIREPRHSPSCQRCEHTRAADRITISIHEWPLPNDRRQTKSVVFELKVPAVFAFWRDTTFFFLFSVLHVNHSAEENPRAEYFLHTYEGLSSFYTKVASSQRISILSQNKPNIRTHRREKQIIDVTESDICLTNGMSFKYFDNTARCFIGAFERTTDIETACTYKLPLSSSCLQKYLFRPAHERNGPLPNTVIASQDACPMGMVLEEYKALCSMPFGVNTQWKNILRQLAMPSVVFKKVETCIFVLQIIGQAGPSKPGMVLRLGHNILSDNGFTVSLLTEIKKAAGRIEENWESAHELCALIFLTQRVLLLSNSTEVQKICLDSLEYFRVIAFNWVVHVRERASSTNGDKHRNDLIIRSVHLALICVATFDSEGTVLDRILETDLNSSIFIQCCIMIQDKRNMLGVISDYLFPFLFYRWQTLAYRCRPILSNNIVYRKKPSLDRAIERTWAAFCPGSSWSVTSSDHWLVTKMQDKQSTHSSLFVHFDLLTGELLINGQPLARLPSEYERHKTYLTLFGQSIVEVMPSDVPGMQFSGKRQHMGQTIHLGKAPFSGTGEFDLCVRAVSHNHVYEFVPPRLLEGAFPDSFIENYAHWYDINSGHVEFRPVEKPWQSSSSYWRLQRRGDQQKSWYLVKGRISLINVKSSTAKYISKVLDPIEKSSQLHCKLYIASSTLEIDLPRLRLGFNLQSGSSSIRSRQYRVLIPEGNITWKKDDNHVTVKIDWKAAASLHVYSVDLQIGRLVDNGSLQSKLVLCYLHAITSFCKPDPLTLKTGTEQSLSILHSASIRSFNPLQAENTEILAKLADLTPKRNYYPTNERVMQTVEWDKNLGHLAQHDDFYGLVAEIFSQDRRMRIFYPEIPMNYPSLPKLNIDLLHRNRIRSSIFHPSEFGAEDHTSRFDKDYFEHYSGDQSERYSNVFTLCRILYDEIPSTRVVMHEVLLAQLWSVLFLSDEVHGPNFWIDMVNIKYDADFILDPTKFVSSNWCSIHRLFCSSTSRPNKYQVMIWLSTLAFSNKIDITVLELLAALYVVPQMASIMPPPRALFHPNQGYDFDQRKLQNLMHLYTITPTPESKLMPNHREKYAKFEKRKQKLEKSNREQALNNLIRGLQVQWPVLCPSTPVCQENPNFQDYFNVQKAMTQVRRHFAIWFNNIELRQYLAEIVSVFIENPVHTISTPSYSIPRAAEASRRKRGFVCMDDLLGLQLSPPPVLRGGPPHLPNLLHTGDDTNNPVLRLTVLVNVLESQAKSKYELQYTDQLRASANSLLEAERNDGVMVNGKELKDILLEYLSCCENYSTDIYTDIISRLKLWDHVALISDKKEPMWFDDLKVMANIDIWPRLSHDALLRQLTRRRWLQLSKKWKKCFIAYGCSITALQRAKRLINLIDHREDLIREIQNPGHTNWNPYDFPESLLLEIENGIIIRDVQEQIAQRMRDISTGNNSVMQLNMGEGKSSVIVPIVAAAFADGSSLARVFVTKPQSRQMFQMLVSKLGGLLDRRIYQMPVSRSLNMGEAEANKIEQMCRECTVSGGILLVQPEHILFLKLMCLECFINGKTKTARSLLRSLDFFRASSRDVVDESDENFSVKFELIYTMGTQRLLEFSPERWVVIQQVLDLVRKYVLVIKREFPHSIEVDQKFPGSFPRMRILHENAGLELFKRVAEHICETGIDSLPISRQPVTTRKSIFTYVLNPDLSLQEIAAVESLDGFTGFWNSTTKEPLLLLRGLVAGGILTFCFGQKRWRVNYGPDCTRKPPTKLSVPYRAKDNPSPRSEFSHPDVVIILTCLSYYYAGLNDDDLFLAFNYLIASDEANTEYQIWVDDAPTLPAPYRQLGGINLQDQHHCIEYVFPNLRFSKGTIDYFLAHIVFPKELKEFPDKLSASGWDIGEVKTHPTVGFSGTNDSRITLPLSVKQLDLQEQNHTNALVLEYLLRPENSVALTPRRDNTSSSDAQVLLNLVVSLDPPTQVILDVGAQILELSNLEVAKNWLKMIPDDGRVQALEVCFVFLDEAHTRGIDLKLPKSYRAAVTLGAGITKDKLVQACMRMRKLGKGQSVVFCIPDEIKMKILSLSGKPNNPVIDVSDVICWAISETWVDMQRSIPLWAVQGQRFERQTNLWRKFHDPNSLSQMSQREAEEFLEPESQSLEHRYRPCHVAKSIFTSISEQSENSRVILARCREFAGLNHSSSQLQEEQERQLAPEIEQERQVQRPAPADPATHYIHPDLRSFVSTGILKESSRAFIHAFEILRNTSAAKFLDVSEFPLGLFTTTDFANTVISGNLSVLDYYQRPVQWVLTSTGQSLTGKNIVKHMVIISPYEANELHSEIQKSNAVIMHIYAPRQNRAFSSLDSLTLYNVPSNSIVVEIPKHLKIQLNLFAGQLYITSYVEYQDICDFLGLSSVKTSEELVVAADGFIVGNNRQGKSSFTQSPLKFLKILMSQIRKDGQKIDKIDMGKIMNGRLLCADDFQELH